MYYEDQYGKVQATRQAAEASSSSSSVPLSSSSTPPRNRVVTETIELTDSDEDV